MDEFDYTCIKEGPTPKSKRIQFHSNFYDDENLKIEMRQHALKFKYAIKLFYTIGN